MAFIRFLTSFILCFPAKCGQDLGQKLGQECGQKCGQKIKYKCKYLGEQCGQNIKKCGQKSVVKTFVLCQYPKIVYLSRPLMTNTFAAKINAKGGIL